MTFEPRGHALPPQGDEPRSRSLTALVIMAVCAGLVFLGLVALGTWQVKRLYWKLDLIERVEQRVHAPAVAAPGPERWPQVTAETHEYRHVRVKGRFLHELSTRVQATTELGRGVWLMTPLRRLDGSTVLVNRGFVSGGEEKSGQAGARGETSRQTEPAGEALTVVTGLLRMSEPGGGFLRENDPAKDRWYSRDVQAIAAARGLSPVAPYFIDADADAAEAPSTARAPMTGESTGASGHPVGGLTVISFRNSHLVYAITWYTLALMVAGGCLWVARDEYRLRRRARSSHADRTSRESDDGKQN